MGAGIWAMLVWFGMCAVAALLVWLADRRIRRNAV
jgi:hypothetical protein